jgi:hypothetical protein
MVFEAAAPLPDGYASDLSWDALDAAVNMSCGLGT